jgi:NAD+ synthase (glutamine-hydrolysing)
MLRLAIVQFRPHKGAYAENLAQLEASFREAAALPDPPDLLLLPETALSGYFLEGGVREQARTAEQAADDIAAAHRASGAPPMDIAIGFYELWRNCHYNSSLYLSLGPDAPVIRHVHRKVFLPTYGVFDEERFVEAGSEVRAFDTGWGRAAMLVCEDAWHSLLPTLAALDGAQVLLVVSATPARGLDSPEAPANLERWERLAADSASEHGMYVAVAQLVGFEGGKAFAGGSVVAGPSGQILARGPLFEAGMIRVDLDFDEITRVRADQPLLADLRNRLPGLLAELNRPRGAPAAVSSWEGRTAVRARDKSAAPAPVADPLAINAELARRWLVEFIRDEVRRRRGFDGVVLGLSGGVDSAVVAYLAAEALGKEYVTAIRMPYRTSSPDSLAHAQLVIEALGIASRTIDITAGVDGIAGALGGPSSPAALGNIMARMRMIALFDLSSRLHALPLGTGNKTERLFGYFTWHADDSPPVNPIGDLFKTQVWALARHLGVPRVIVEKPASADLIQGQTDERDFGITYARADGILHWLLSGYRPEQVVARGFTPAEVDLVRKRLDSTHWKRRLPTVAMLSPTAIGEYYLRPVDY